MRLTWLAEGSMSLGQLKGKRPDSSTYSDTPHDQISALCPLYLPCTQTNGQRSDSDEGALPNVPALHLPQC